MQRPMQRQLIYTVVCLWLGAFGCASALAQTRPKPFTKAEILQRLKPVPGQRAEQGELAGEIEERGIAFPVTEVTLEELRKAGAKAFLLNAILRVDPAAPKAPEPEPPASGEPRLRPRPELPPGSPSGEAVPRVTEAAPEPQPEPVLTEEERRAARAAELAKLPLLEQARAHALEFMDELPNFVVTQLVTRAVQQPGDKDFKVEDKLEVDLSYHERRGEVMKLLKLNGKPTTQSYESLGGTTSTGEFGTILAGLFLPQAQADFREVRQETFRGRATTVFTYKVKKAFSNNQITDKSSGRSVITAYEGTVWIEQATARVLRLESSATDIQRGFPITLAESAIEYDWVSIADLKFLLPISAEVLLGNDAQRFYSRNTLELRNYRMFDSDVKIVP